MPVSPFWRFMAVGAAVLVLSGAGLALYRPSPHRRSPYLAAPVGGIPESPAEAATLPPDPIGLAGESIIEAQRKRVMGRLRSFDDVRRVTTTIRPLIDQALRTSGVQADLRALARAAGMSLNDYRDYFAAKEEADLLLESGGDPNARSSADAIGVAQYLVGTAQRCGLRVEPAASRRLSAQIAALEQKIGWLSAQPPAWTRAIPPGLAGVIPTIAPAGDGDEEASQVPVPAAAAAPNVWTRDQWIAYRRMQWRSLVAKRRRVDERYDPAKAVPAQARYLVRLARRYGSVDWALQAYHGGEAGAAKTLALFRRAPHVHERLASRGSGLGFRQLPYSAVYAAVSPGATPAAFSYLFGRSDDHRYYWWKVLMAERALNLYRKDPEEFTRQWRALKPGYSTDVAWYPDPAPLQLRDNEALREAYRSGDLVPLPPNAAAFGVRTAHLAALAPEAAQLHKGLRPEAMGALLRVTRGYRAAGGSGPVTVVAMTQSTGYRALWDARYPPRPLPPGVPEDPEYHTTGLVFDLKVPDREWDRKVLQYALGRLSDTQRISWRPERDGGSARYHVVVNPGFREEMIDYYRKAAG